MFEFTPLLYLLTLIRPILSTPLTPRQLVTPPSSDPFYTPPANYTTAPPGSILRTRAPPSPIAAFDIIPIVLQSSQQILFSSTDSFGNPTATVVTVLTPLDADPGKLLSYQIAEDASYLNCAPSYALQFLSDTGGLFGTVGSQAEILAIAAALQNGWVVSVPDHEGPNAAFLANTRGGHAVLDSVRAVLSSGLVDPAARVAMWGYSGGSLASGFAAELQPSYAPELADNLVGVALGGTVPNITSSIPYINASPFTGLLPAGVLGLSHEYPAIATIVEAELLPEKAAAFRQADAQCLGANVIQFLEQDVVDTYFVDGYELLNSDPTVREVEDANAMGQAVPQVPVYLYKGALDEISPVEDTDALYDVYCDGGRGTLEYERDATAEHVTLLLTGIPAAVGWLKGRLEGEAVAPGCVRRDVVSSLADAVAAGVAEGVTEALEALTGLSAADLAL